LREPKRKIVNPDRLRETKKMVSTTKEWSNIPYYPTSKEKKEEYAHQLASMGKQVPQELLRQIEQDKAKEVANDAFNANIVKPPPQAQQVHLRQYPPAPTTHANTPVATQSQAYKQIPHKYSPQYAAYIGAKPRAQASARVGMGGLYK
jgi:hypothetical protein